MNSTAEASVAASTFLALSLIALAFHEAAHIVMAWALGIRVKRVGISWRGPFVIREAGGPRANICIALVGPLMNLILAACFRTYAPNFAFLNLALGLSNLLPIQGSDGLRIWTVLGHLRADIKSSTTGQQLVNDPVLPKSSGAIAKRQAPDYLSWS